MGVRALRASLFSLLTLVAACVVYNERADLPRYDPARYAGITVPTPTPSPPFAWADGSDYAIVVSKKNRTLNLYRWQQREKTYPIVLGIAPDGPKTYRGDLRTPEGVYRISGKRVHPRWSRFMLLSYPNEGDLQRYAMALNARRVPVIDGEPAGPGSAIGIHGSDRERENLTGVDWTWGCVSMLNEDVAELYDLVPVGTPVLIER